MYVYIYPALQNLEVFQGERQGGNGNKVTRKDSKRAEVLNGDFINILALGCTENIAPKVMQAVSLL